MNQAIAPKMAQELLQSLASAIQQRIHPLQWWQAYVLQIPAPSRANALSELAASLATHMSGTHQFAQDLAIDKSLHSDHFEEILFKLLLPIHDHHVVSGNWAAALQMEMTLYAAYIKQDEDWDFYETVFGRLYAPYRSLNTAPQLLTAPSVQTEEKTLFWFQNYSILAHSTVCLEFVESLPMPGRFYVSAVSNVGLDQSRSAYTSRGITPLPVNDQLDVAARCRQLVDLCRQHQIGNIVFVSVPLQSGYLRVIAGEIKLTWWSMKYPLGCLTHFDRLVCNRSIEPETRQIKGMMWRCAPFALKPLPAPSKPVASRSGNALNLGILSREEKLASSDLPEIMSRTLAAVADTHLYWTGRHNEPSLEGRLLHAAPDALKSRIQFCGWVDPANFLNAMDLLIDTPNLGGVVAYWMMSIGKVVLSASDTGSIGALGSRTVLSHHFDLLRSETDVENYFSSRSDRPYYLETAELIPACITTYACRPDLLAEHGARFQNFFKSHLSNMESWSSITYRMLQGRE